MGCTSSKSLPRKSSSFSTTVDYNIIDLSKAPTPPPSYATMKKRITRRQTSPPRTSSHMHHDDIFKSRLSAPKSGFITPSSGSPSLEEHDGDVSLRNHLFMHSAPSTPIQSVPDIAFEKFLSSISKSKQLYQQYSPKSPLPLTSSSLSSLSSSSSSSSSSISEPLPMVNLFLNPPPPPLRIVFLAMSPPPYSYKTMIIQVQCTRICPVQILV